MNDTQLDELNGEREPFPGLNEALVEMEQRPATTPFPITKAADRDEMRPFRETARWMDEGDSVEGLATVDAAKLAKAIVEKYGVRTATVETVGDFKRVIRVAQRPERKPRKAGEKKVAAPKGAKNA